MAEFVPMDALTKALADQKALLNEGLDIITERARGAGHQIDRSTIHRYLNGQTVKRPSEKVIQALAAGFKMPPEEIRDLLKLPPGEPGPWVPVEESVRLNRDQRTALDALIKTMVGASEDHGPADEGVHTSDEEQSTPEGSTNHQTPAVPTGFDIGDLDIPRLDPLRSDDDSPAEQPEAC